MEVVCNTIQRASERPITALTPDLKAVARKIDGAGSAEAGEGVWEGEAEGGGGRGGVGERVGGGTRLGQSINGALCGAG